MAAAAAGVHAPLAAPRGQLSIVAGIGAAGRAKPSRAVRSPLNAPFRTVVDGRGDVYIADTGNNEIEKVTPGATLSVVAGTGAPGRAVSGAAAHSPLHYPYGVAVDGRGAVYIADTFNVMIEKVTPNGTLSVLAGTGRAGPATPGRATHSDLKYPYGVGCDARGTVYIADTFNAVIEKVTRTGVLSIVAGTGVPGKVKPGKATRSPLGHPTGVILSPGGNLYLADEQADEVLKITAAKA